MYLSAAAEAIAGLAPVFFPDCLAEPAFTDGDVPVLPCCCLDVGVFCFGVCFLDYGVPVADAFLAGDGFDPAFLLVVICYCTIFLSLATVTFLPPLSLFGFFSILVAGGLFAGAFYFWAEPPSLVGFFAAVVCCFFPLAAAAAFLGIVKNV